MIYNVYFKHNTIKTGPFKPIQIEADNLPEAKGIAKERVVNRTNKEYTIIKIEEAK